MKKKSNVSDLSNYPDISLFHDSQGWTITIKVGKITKDNVGDIIATIRSLEDKDEQNGTGVH